MSIKSSVSQSCLVLKINTYNPLARFFRISQALHPVTCGRCPGNGQRRLLIVQCGSMGGVLVLDGRAHLEIAQPYSAPVKGSQAIGRHSPKIIQPFCGSEFTVAICSSVEPMLPCCTGIGKYKWILGRGCKDGFTGRGRRKVRTNGAIRRALRVVGFHKTPRSDYIQDSAMARICAAIFDSGRIFFVSANCTATD